MKCGPGHVNPDISPMQLLAGTHSYHICVKEQEIIISGPYLEFLPEVPSLCGHPRQWAMWRATCASVVDAHVSQKII